MKAGPRRTCGLTPDLSVGTVTTALNEGRSKKDLRGLPGGQPSWPAMSPSMKAGPRRTCGLGVSTRTEMLATPQ